MIQVRSNLGCLERIQEGGWSSYWQLTQIMECGLFRG